MGSVQQELNDADLPVYIHTLSPGMVLTGAPRIVRQPQVWTPLCM